MFRIWGKLFKNNRMLKDMVYEDNNPSLNRTKKVFAGIHELCLAFDLPEPVWLDKNITEFKKIDKTRFDQDNFIESVGFDYFEIQVIEEDSFY